MWRGGFGSIGCGRRLSWRRHPCCRTFTPFPHPAHRTGHADFPHPALGQDIIPLHTKGHPQFARPTAQGSCFPSVHRPCILRTTANATTWAVIRFPEMIRVLPSLQHAACSAAPAHYRSFLGLPQSPVLCHFQLMESHGGKLRLLHFFRSMHGVTGLIRGRFQGKGATGSKCELPMI